MYKVLLADDIEPFRRKIKRLPFWRTEHAAFEIAFEASDGLRALEILKNNKVDVVITDIRMPVIDGIDLLKEIRKDSLCPCVILLSEFADFSYAKEGIINGAFDYLVKPVDEEEMTDTLERAEQFLDSLERSASPLKEYQHQLSKNILSMDKEKAALIADRITSELLRGSKEESQFLLSVYQCITEVAKDLTRDQPFLAKYVSFEDIAQVSVSDLARYGKEGVLSGRIGELFDELQIFRIDDYSENVKKLCQLAMDQEENRQSLGEIADRFYMNAKYLGSQFKWETGMSYNQYVNQLKIYRAKRLLKNKKLKIFEIAEQLGFDSVEYFNKVFKKETGQSPGSYRKEA